MIRNDDTRQPPARPDVNGIGEIHRVIERSCFDRDGLGFMGSIMPNAAAASGTETADQRVAAIGRSGPGLRLPFDQAKPGSWHQKREAERGDRKFLAFVAMADIEAKRLTTTFISNLATLTAAGQH